jgi:hypothetical protein
MCNSDSSCNREGTTRLRSTPDSRMLFAMREGDSDLDVHSISIECASLSVCARIRRFEFNNECVARCLLQCSPRKNSRVFGYPENSLWVKEFLGRFARPLKCYRDPKPVISRINDLLTTHRDVLRFSKARETFASDIVLASRNLLSSTIGTANLYAPGLSEGRVCPRLGRMRENSFTRIET